MSLEETITLARSHVHGGPPVDVPVPRQLGHVRLLKEIGRGGTGVVYTGRDELLNRIVAVKFLSGAVPTANDPGFAEFLEGARAAAAIQRSGLTTVYQAGVVDGLPYVIMQYVDGPAVGHMLRHEPFTLPDALSVLVEAVELTSALHDLGIVHRDIKPGNLLVSGEGHVFLTDFGLAHRRRNLSDTRPIAWAGTPAYMAPEMFDGQVSPKSDVYALGITAFELIAGRMPFTGTIEEMQQMHQSVELPADELKSHGVKPALLEVIERAAHKRQMFRYKTAGQFARALRAACPDLGTPMQIEMRLSQRVNRCRAGFTPGPGSSTSQAVGSAATTTTAASDADTPRSAGSLHEHISALVSLKKSLRDASTVREKLQQLHPAPAAPDDGSKAGSVTLTDSDSATAMPPAASPAAPRPAERVPQPPASVPVAEAPAPAPASNAPIHCLHCGYDRRAMPSAAPCPDCGRPDRREAAAAVCLATAISPLRLAGRYLLFRRLPLGWWELLDPRQPAAAALPRRSWSVVLLAALLAFAGALGFTALVTGIRIDYVTSHYLYYATDAKQVKVQDEPSSHVSASVFDDRPPDQVESLPAPPVGLGRKTTTKRSLSFQAPARGEWVSLLLEEALGFAATWALYRYGWLASLVRSRANLSPEDRARAAIAASGTAPLLLAAATWQAVFIVVGLMIFLADPARFTPLAIVRACWAAVALLLIPWYAWRSIAADESRRIFLRRTAAITLPLLGGMALAIWLGISFGIRWGLLHKT